MSSPDKSLALFGKVIEIKKPLRSWVLLEEVGVEFRLKHLQASLTIFFVFRQRSERRKNQFLMSSDVNLGMLYLVSVRDLELKALIIHLSLKNEKLDFLPFQSLHHFFFMFPSSL